MIYPICETLLQAHPEKVFVDSLKKVNLYIKSTVFVK